MDKEVEYPHWDMKSGQDDPALSVSPKNFTDGHFGLQMPILQAKTFEWLLRNVQIEMNPYNICTDEINIGIYYERYANWDLFAKNMYARFNEEVQDREIPAEQAG